MDMINFMKQLRAALMDFTADVPDEKAVKYPALFDPWKKDTLYKVGVRVERNGKLWKCLQAHTSQDGWTPAETSALWVEIALPGEYREIKENMLSTESFQNGEIGWYKFKDNLFKSLIDNNVYTPDSYPDGWEAIN